MVVEFGGFTSAKAKFPWVRVVVDDTMVIAELLLTIHPVGVSNPMIGLLRSKTGRGNWAAAVAINISVNARLFGAYRVSGVMAECAALNRRRTPALDLGFFTCIGVMQDRF
jgi:hypothetical protein